MGVINLSNSIAFMKWMNKCKKEWEHCKYYYDESEIGKIHIK